MYNNLETFVKTHRNEFDTLEPSANLWNNINHGIQQPGFMPGKISWLKYFGLGASVVITTLVFLKPDPDKAQKISVPSAITKTTVKTQENINEVEVMSPGKETNVASSELNLIVPIKNNSNEPLPFNTISAEQNNPATEPNIEAKNLSDYAPGENKTTLQPEKNYSNPLVIEEEASEKIHKDGNHQNTLLNIDTVFSGIKRLEITVNSFDVNVKPNTANAVHIMADMTSETKGLVFGNPEYNVQYIRKDSILKVTVINNSGGYKVMGGSVNIESNFNVELPSGIELIVINSYGNINVNGITGKLCDLQTRSGEIKLQNISSTLTVKSGYGDLQANNIKGNLTALITSGDFHLTGMEGNTDIKSTYGEQKFNNITGDILSKSTSGDIKITDMKGNTEIISSYGNVNLENYKGNTKMNIVSGDVTGKDVELLDNMTVVSSYGNIKMNLLNEMDNLSFDLLSNYGKININKGGQKMEEEGKVLLKQGRIMIKATTTSGDQTYK